MTRRSITFRQYLTRRGYDLRAGSGMFLRRMFLAAWAEPGFHRFWRIWNPLYGYFLFRLFCILGGNRRRAVSTVTVFLVCGLVLHDLPVALVTRHWQMTTTVAFLVFGVVTVLAQWAEKRLGFSEWPPPAHVVLNVGLVVGGVLFGAWFQGRFIAP